MNNTTVCRNCQTENPFYQLICKKCKGFIRERVFNIDLWKVLGLLIENPMKGFTTIVYSEHKNFTSLLILLAAGKLAVDLIFFSIQRTGNPVNFFGAYLLSVVGLAVILSAFSFILFYAGRFINSETRIKDNFSILAYSLIPHIFGFIILFPIEIVVFGGNLFSGDVSPFIIKPGIAYTFLVIELFIVIWGIFLTAAAVFTQFRKLFISIIIAAGFYAVMFSYCYYVTR